MKSLHRLSGIVLLAVATLGTLAQSAPTLANTYTRVLRDIEPNDIQANSASFNTKITLAITGKLSTNEDLDNFTFTVEGPAQSLTLKPSNNPSPISYILLEDRNGNGRRDTSDPVISKGQTNSTRIELKGRRRFLIQVHGNRGDSASVYNFRVNAFNSSPTPPRPNPPCTNCHTN